MDRLGAGHRRHRRHHALACGGEPVNQRGRYWNNREVHFFWESPLMALALLASLAMVMAVL